MAIQHDIIENLIRFDQMAREDGKKYPLKRFLFNRLEYLLTQTRQMAGISGLRGTGKTVLLRQLSIELDHAFYISADTLPPRTDLFELAELLKSTLGVRYLIIDEIHAILEWQGHLKKITDFTDIRVLFTSSSSLELMEGRYDLSRRLTMQHLPLFSFREYLMFGKSADFPVVSLDEILGHSQDIYRQVYSYEPEFREYSSLRAMPACLESPLPSVVTAIIEKILQKDLLSSAKLSQEDILQIRSVLLFLARAGIEGCSYSSVSRNLGITKYKAQQYIALLLSASLLNLVLPYGANVLPEPKILFTPVLRNILAQGIDADRLTGTMREEFFIHHVLGTGLTVNYLKSLRGQKLPDYIIFHGEKKLIFEIGGAGKGAAQFKGVEGREKVILTQPGVQKGIPLILFGFLW